MKPVPDSGGVLPVDKPSGPTSHDVVALARRALDIRKIGHTGTLDPFASGLLLLCVGPATRIAEYLVGAAKTYEAVARLGVRTDTLDLEGRVVQEEEGWRDIGRERLDEAIRGLTGTQDQVPPAFSAKKVRGEAAYRKARRGEVVELAPARVTVHALEVTSFAPPDVRLRLRCSSGTYVRAIARDLGEALGVGAHLRELRRTAVGPMRVENAVDLDVLRTGAVEDGWIAPADAVAHLPRVDIGVEEAERLLMGQSLEREGEIAPGSAAGDPTPGPIAALLEGRLVAVLERRGDLLRPRKVFYRP